MIKAVLLDMDNTLLRNPDKVFARAFIDIFQSYFADMGTDDATSRFRHAIQAMSQSQRGDITNTELTIQMMGDNNHVRELLQQFYQDVYPHLQHCIAPVKGAADLITYLLESGYAVVIATNPIYPDTAIRQRLAWAGLDIAEIDQCFITSGDNMHFAKPDPAYYAEILGRVGIEPDEALMVGDSLKNDIKPAGTVGLQTYHIGDKTLLDFREDFHSIVNTQQPLLLKPEMIEPQLRGNIGAVFGFLDTISKDAYWHQHPDPDEWSIIQILCHLVDSEKDNERPRLKAILEKDNPFITQPEQPGLDIPVCADEGYSVAYDFMVTRQQTIDLISDFSDDVWQRPARHSIFGLTTMLEMAYFTAQHDRLHLNQLCQTIGRCD